jgi:hypothetical protein
VWNTTPALKRDISAHCKVTECGSVISLHKHKIEKLRNVVPLLGDLRPKFPNQEIKGTTFHKRFRIPFFREIAERSSPSQLHRWPRWSVHLTTQLKSLPFREAQYSHLAHSTKRSFFPCQPRDAHRSHRIHNKRAPDERKADQQHRREVLFKHEYAQQERDRRADILDKAQHGKR